MNLGLKIGIGVVAVAAVGTAGYFIYKSYKEKQDAKLIPQMPEEPAKRNLADYVNAGLNIFQAVKQYTPLSQRELEVYTKELNSGKVSEDRMAEIAQILKNKKHKAVYIPPIANGFVAPMMGVNAGWVIKKA